MATAEQVLALSLGGVLGVNARYWLGVWVAGWASPRFPWATFTINASGCFLFGLLAVTVESVPPSWLGPVKLAVLTGFLGGYTTFSTFSYESAVLWERKAYAWSLANLGGSVAVGSVAVVLGMALGVALGAEAPGPRRDVPASKAGDEVVRPESGPTLRPGSE